MSKKSWENLQLLVLLSVAMNATLAVYVLVNTVFLAAVINYGTKMVVVGIFVWHNVLLWSLVYIHYKIKTFTTSTNTMWKGKQP